jgi:hypothetical protein
MRVPSVCEINDAEPGDVITVAPGTMIKINYIKSLTCGRPGTALSKRPQYGQRIRHCVHEPPENMVPYVLQPKTLTLTDSPLPRWNWPGRINPEGDNIEIR